MQKSGSRSLIDHILISYNIRDCVKSCNSIDSVENNSDHIAINIELDINCDYFASSEISHLPRPAWYKASIEDTNKYKKELDCLLNEIQYPGDLFLCRNVDCKEHLEKIECFHDNIISACLKAGKKALPHTGKKKSRENNKKAGWNEYCRDKKEIALFWHVKWKNEGSQHNTFVAHMRNKARLQYHYAIRRIDKNNNALKSERMAENCIKGKRDMWEEAKKMRGNNCKLPSMVDNTVGDNNISNLFLDKFNHFFYICWL